MSDGSDLRRSPSFATTRWSLVLAARGDEVPAGAAQAALGELCERYWPPLYAFLRRRGESPEDARDLVQGFFARLLEKGDLGLADPARGRFRAFLLTACKHFTSNQHARERAQKRGGGRAPLSLDFSDAEQRIDPAEERTPEDVFEAEWARALLDRIFEQLRAEHEVRDKLALFDALAPWIGAEAPREERAALAERLAVSEGSLRVALHRLRRRYRDLLRAEVAETVADPGEVDLELAALRAALAR